ncbi:MAG: DUF4440 domain-containing protein, partial [Verrucomicrobiota bacterium]|nr:DUF4440 domain-containing protein [Verrucomicrobiota bacterium]
MKISLLFLLALAPLRLVAQAPEDPGAAAARTVLEDERKFYEVGQELGTRAAFLEFLADDSIIFHPGPVDGKKEWSKRPEKGISLKWKPLFVAMSRSADLGYTT